MKNNETNIQFLKRMMDSDPMMNMVIIQGLITYIDLIAGNPEAEARFLKQMENHPMISGEGWLETVKLLKAEMAKKYGPMAS